DTKTAIDSASIEKFFGRLSKEQRAQLMTDLSKDRTASSQGVGKSLIQTMDDWNLANRTTRASPAGRVADMLAKNPEMLKQRTVLDSIARFSALSELKQRLTPEQLKTLDEGLKRLNK